MKLSGALICCWLLPFLFQLTTSEYTPDWKSLDSRPLPGWFDDAKFGIFMHWGVYSVPTFGNEWFWEIWKTRKDPRYIEFMRKNFKPGFSYQDFSSGFTAENFDPVEWTELFVDSGAKYVVLTSKHHDGYTLWPSAYSYGWNSVDTGPHRDLVGDLAKAVREHSNITFGLYHSLYEWYNPMYMADKKANYKSKVFPDNKVIPEMKELVNLYKPEYIWSDGDWEASEHYWRSTDFLAWLFNDSPVKDSVIVNSRWGKMDDGKVHGSIATPSDGYHPGKLIDKKWENAKTLCSGSWAYRPEAPLKDYHTTSELLEELVSTISYGGNFLLDVGPSANGRIMPILEERLRDLGAWLRINGQAIYKSQPWIHQNDTVAEKVWYTKREDRVYAIALKYPESNKINLASMKEYVRENSKVTMLGYDGEIKIITEDGHVTVEFPSAYQSFKINRFGWVFEFENLHDDMV